MYCHSSAKSIRIGTSATTTLATITTTTASACSSIAVTFNELATTAYGTTVKIAGSIAALGSWNSGSAVALSASGYTASNPLWSVTINFAPATSFEYKFIQVSSTGTVSWESGSNRAYTVAASAGVCSVTVGSNWK